LTDTPGNLREAVRTLTDDVEHGSKRKRGWHFLSEQPIRFQVKRTERIEHQLVEPIIDCS
jgi:hypothetical protein